MHIDMKVAFLSGAFLILGTLIGTFGPVLVPKNDTGDIVLNVPRPEISPEQTLEIIDKITSAIEVSVNDNSAISNQIITYCQRRSNIEAVIYVNEEVSEVAKEFVDGNIGNNFFSQINGFALNLDWLKLYSKNEAECVEIISKMLFAAIDPPWN